MSTQLIINMNKKTFRPDEVAQLLSLSRRTVYRMIRDGRLPGIRFGSGPWRIPRETLVPLLTVMDSGGCGAENKHYAGYDKRPTPPGNPKLLGLGH